MGQASVPRTHGKVCEGGAGVVRDGGERAGKEFGFETGTLPARGRLRKASLLGWSLGNLSPFSPDRRILADIVACMLPSSDSVFVSQWGHIGPE